MSSHVHSWKAMEFAFVVLKECCKSSCLLVIPEHLRKKITTIYHNGEEDSICYFRESNPGLQISYVTDWPGPYKILKHKYMYIMW
jgi:hypothetical protein